MPRSGPSPTLPHVALDTSAYSHLRRGHTAVIDIIACAEVVELCATVLGELEAGFRLGSRYQENIETLEEFLREPFVRTEPLAETAARRYSVLFATLRRNGTPIPVNDIWIASAALTTGAHLITFDSDFQKIPSLPHTLLKSRPDSSA